MTTSKFSTSGAAKPQRACLLRVDPNDVQEHQADEVDDTVQSFGLRRLRVRTKTLSGLPGKGLVNGAGALP